MTERLDGETLVRYLLGELPPSEEADLDERCFVDDDCDEQRGVAADDLIDAYLAGELDAGRRRRFEDHFLATSAHVERFELVRDLRAVVTPRAHATARKPQPPWIWLVAAALVVAIAVFALRALRPRPDTPRLVHTPETVPLPSPEYRSPLPAPKARVERVALPDRPRPVAVAVGADVQVVRFQVPVPQSPLGYRATIARDGRRVWQQAELQPADDGGPLAIPVPADVLAAGDCTISIEPEALRGASPDSRRGRSWALRIVRR